MKFIPLYVPGARRRGHFLKPWVRWALFVVVAIPAIHYGIKGFFGLMPVTEKLLQGWGLIP